MTCRVVNKSPENSALYKLHVDTHFIPFLESGTFFDRHRTFAQCFVSRHSKGIDYRSSRYIEHLVSIFGVMCTIGIDVSPLRLPGLPSMVVEQKIEVLREIY